MVDWSLARQIARFAAGNAHVPDLGVDLGRMSAAAERQVADYTGLSLPGPPPPPEMIDRATWAEINIDTLAALLDPVGGRLSDRLGSAGPLAGPLRAASPEVGRLVTSVLAVSALNDWAQAGFAWLRGKANQVPS